VTLGLLMVSKVRYDTLPKISARAIRKEPWKFVFSMLAVIVVAVSAGSAIFPLLVLFIILGMVRYVGTTVKRVFRTGPRFEEDEQVNPSRADSRSDR
jgi:CDP-diacylglycerol---serine O-phosphatidyltransferase